MSSSLPVPSRGVLRVLRHIALGTSCTVAFGTGVITEDRRRRIHIARKASENARKLRASGRYHSTGLSVATTFEEQVENYCKHGPWKGGDKQKLLDPETSNPHYYDTFTAKRSGVKTGSSITSSKPSPRKARQYGRIDAHKMPKKQALIPIQHQFLSERSHSSVWADTGTAMVDDTNNSITWELSKTQNVDDADNAILDIPVENRNNDGTQAVRSFDYKENETRTQTELATQISEILRNGATKGITKVVEAVSIFHKNFQAQVINQDLLDACILLGQECDSCNGLDIFITVLSKLLSCGQPIDEGSFYKLHVGKAIARLLEQSGYRHTYYQIVEDIEKLEHAVAIFVANPGENPKPLPMELRDIGLQLCTATLRADLCDLTERVYGRLSFARTDLTASEVECIIIAMHRRAHYGQVLYRFSKYFSQTVPDQNQLYSVVGAGVESALKLGRIDTAEEILSTANHMARNGKMRTSTKWHLQVLGEHWRTSRNMATTQALFSRLAVFMEHMSHPQAMYSAMVQFCVEAGLENEAQQYIDHLIQLGDENDMGIRTRGHLALAKAMKNDWEGVKEDFSTMQKFARGSIQEHSNAFVPILKIFVASHGAGQVENFIRFYIEQLDIEPNQYIFNVMIDTYCKAGELNNIPRWIEYVKKRGLQIDAVTFNTILSRYRKQWAVHPDELFRIYRETNRRVGFIFDSTTVQILHHAAHSSTTPANAAQLIKQVKQVKQATAIKCHQIEREMQIALDRGDHTEILNFYKIAVQSGRQISPRWFFRAVQASIRSAADGNLASTVELINDGRLRGFDILPSMAHLLLHQVNTSKCGGDELVSLINHTLTEFDSRGLIVTPFIASKLISELVNRGRPIQALVLWKTLASRDHIARQPTDLVLLTVLLRAYIMLFDLAGIKWVTSVLRENDVIPDMQLRLMVKEGRRQARRLLEAQPDSSLAKQRYEVLDECMQLVISIRMNVEMKRKEAERSILSIVESAFVASPGNVREMSKMGSAQALRGKSSQDLINRHKIRKDSRNHTEFKKRNEVVNIRDCSKIAPTNDPENMPQIREDKVSAGEQIPNEIELPPRPDAKKFNQVTASPLTSKQALSGYTELDIKRVGGYHESAWMVEVVSG